VPTKVIFLWAAEPSMDGNSRGRREARQGYRNRKKERLEESRWVRRVEALIGKGLTI